jgi:hypothetical protein
VAGPVRGAVAGLPLIVIWLGTSGREVGVVGNLEVPDRAEQATAAPVIAHAASGVIQKRGTDRVLAL